MAKAQAQRTHCPRGHPYDLVSSGRRRCLRCKRERWAERHPKPTITEYVWARIHRAPGGCWEWVGPLDGDGYGIATFRRARWYAHRLLYELLVGPIPPGLTLDHTCRNHACVNPSHLEPVTIAENVRRGAVARRALAEATA